MVRFTYLTEVLTDTGPSIWLDMLHKGIRLEFRPETVQFMGVSDRAASLVGLILGCLLLIPVVVLVDAVWLAALLPFVYGLAVRAVGAALIKAWMRLRDLVAS